MRPSFPTRLGCPLPSRKLTIVPSRFPQRNASLQPQNDLFAGYNPQRRNNSASSNPSSISHPDSRSANGHLFDSYPTTRPSSKPSSYGGAPPRTSSPYSKPGSQANGHGHAPLHSSAYDSTPLPGPSSSSRCSTDSSSLLPRYSDSSRETLESQNGAGVALLTDKVRQLRQLTGAIGAEIRDSSLLADGINERFEGTQLKLRGTMGRMLRMAERSGVGWRIWVGFLGFVAVLFFWVWI